MTDQPADLLTAAAKLMRDQSNAASPGPWLTTSDATPWLAKHVVFGQSMHMAARISQVCDLECGQNRTRDAAYIALMHPGVGLAVAAWLDDAGRRVRAAEQTASRVWPNPDADDLADRDQWIANHASQPALAVARAVLGQDGQQ